MRPRPTAKTSDRLNPPPGGRAGLRVRYSILVYCIYLYTFFEWLFYVTMPSFVSSLSWVETLVVLFVAPIPFLISVGMGASVFEGIHALGLPLPRAVAKVIRHPRFTAIPAALILGFGLLLLIDNFTYTLFEFGIIVSKGFRVLYLAALVGLVWHFTAVVVRAESALARKQQRSVLGALVLIGATVVALYAAISQPLEIPPYVPRTDVPNILFLASDGLSAESMSAYGYDRDTTPFLRQLKPKTLFFENAFSNIRTTYGSLVSMLTGKLPLRTKVIVSPYVLSGADVFQHLPGILRTMGYKAFQSTVRYHADSRDANMLLAFDEANGRTINNQIFETFIRHTSSSLLSEFFLSSRIYDRFKNRVNYMLGLDDLERHFSLVKHKVGDLSEEYKADDKRIQDALAFIDKTPEPWFIHMHLMVTHCCKFMPKVRKWSVGLEQTVATSGDFYDDAIASADDEFRTMFQELEKRGKLNNTIVVISSDHAKAWTVKSRVPLMIYFPNQKYTGVVKENVQLVDIAPTMLDAIGSKAPSWMDGLSLLPTHRLSAMRPLSIVSDIEDWLVDGSIVVKRKGPPYYSVDILTTVFCNKWYDLDLMSGVTSSGPVAAHTAPCEPSVLPDEQLARDTGLKRLGEFGFGFMVKNAPSE